MKDRGIDSVGFGSSLDENGSDSLGSAVAVARIVEGTATALVSEHSQTKELQSCSGSEGEMGTRHDGRVALLLADGVHGQLQGQQRRRAGCVHRERGALNTSWSSRLNSSFSFYLQIESV